MYAIIDVETTGTSAAFGKITEVAVVLHNGTEITETYSSLVNPECTIPYQITRLTGITNEMVADAPKFFEIARKLVELTAGKMFVAHNAQFDYSFFKEEFKRLGYEYKRKTICTVKLSRRLLPGHRSYSLGNLCQDLGIDNHSRHRALGDALATAELFTQLIRQNTLAESKLFVENYYPLPKEKMDALPEKPGVYYFYDNRGELIYVGKSKSIRQRVMTHLTNSTTKKAIEMRHRMNDLSWEETGSELLALLLESSEIKRHRPFYNRSQRRSAQSYGLFLTEEDGGYFHLKIDSCTDDQIPLTTFHFHQEGIDYLRELAYKYALCLKLCHLENGQGCCFQNQIHQCMGACEGKEAPDEYNKRVEKAIGMLRYRSQNFFILDTGRIDREKSVVKIEGGSYRGFGYIDIAEGIESIEQLHECIRPYADNRDIKRIISGYLKSNKTVKIIEFRKG